MEISPASLLVRKVLVGCSIVLLIAFEAPAYSACTWKTSDIMDQRIDIGAQKSLMRQMSAGLPHSRQASAMIGAIKSGELEAIYLPPRQAVALRANRMTPKKFYWQLLSSRNSVCLLMPAGEKPIIVYRQKLPGDLIDIALRDAWAKCGLQTPEQPCEYVADRWAMKKCAQDSEEANEWFKIYYTCLGCKEGRETKAGTAFYGCPHTVEESSCLGKLTAELKKCVKELASKPKSAAYKECEVKMQWDKRSTECSRRYRDQAKHSYCKNKANAAINCEHERGK